MDLPLIGKHCARCRTLDLLPLTCPTCSQTFCSAHIPFASHGCPEPVAPSETAGPSSATIASAQPCELPGCSKPRMVIFDLKAGATEVGQAVACPACAGFFCLAHRAAHSCKPLPLADAAARAHTRELIRETYGASGSASAAAPKPPSAPPPAKRVKKAGSAAIELMRLKQFSKQGRGEVRERADRWHLRIQIDLKAEGAWTEPATREADRKLEGTYWKKDMTVGQIKQAMITKHGIQYDPVAGDPSSLIHLVHIPPDGQPPVELASATAIASACEDGAWVVLVRGSGWQSP